MSSRFNILTFGELDDVEIAVDRAPLTEAETRAVLLNLINRVRRLEQANEARHQQTAQEIALRLEQAAKEQRP